MMPSPGSLRPFATETALAWLFRMLRSCRGALHMLYECSSSPLWDFAEKPPDVCTQQALIINCLLYVRENSSCMRWLRTRSSEPM